MKQLRLRAAEPDDVDAIWRWENDHAGKCGGRMPVSRMQVWTYVQTYHADLFADGEARLVVEVDGRAVGLVDLTEVDVANGRAAVSIYIAEAERGRGYGLGALHSVARLMRGSLHQLWAMVAADNAASRALFAAAGYKTAGRLRSWIRRDRGWQDAVAYQLMLDAVE